MVAEFSDKLTSGDSRRTFTSSLVSVIGVFEKSQRHQVWPQLQHLCWLRLNLVCVIPSLGYCLISCLHSSLPMRIWGSLVACPSTDRLLRCPAHIRVLLAWYPMINACWRHYQRAGKVVLQVCKFFFHPFFVGHSTHALTVHLNIGLHCYSYKGEQSIEFQSPLRSVNSVQLAFEWTHKEVHIAKWIKKFKNVIHCSSA